MDKQEEKSVDLLGILKSWIPWKSESDVVSRDFWMPDHSCRVCYECDAQFTVFNRRHHCRICGRIFCAKCTANSVPVGNEAHSSSGKGEGTKVRVCNYCFKQWEQGLARVGKGPHDDFDLSPSAASIDSPKSSGAAYGSFRSMSFGLSEQISDSFSISPYQSAVMDPSGDVLEVEGSENICIPYYEDPSVVQYGLSTNRSSDDDDDDEDDDVFYSCELDFRGRNYSHGGDCYGPIEYDNAYNSHNFVSDMDNADTKSLASTAFHDSYDAQDGGETEEVEKKDDGDIGGECASSLYAAEDVNIEPVDFENNGLLWLPPEPENEDDDREFGFCDGDDDGDRAGEWGCLRASDSFGSGQRRGRERSLEEQKAAMKNIVDGHFRALVSQLLQVEDIPFSDSNIEESWLEIIVALSWEAATLLKPDTSKGGGMDPGGYVKVKCIASGRPSESMVIAGMVCKKNVAHRRMRTRIDKPRIMILGGALEYQRVSNVLSSFDTLLQQEMDHLKMAVAKIDAHQPNILLVEKSVSRYAQEYILAKDISLVLNIKRQLLERISRCTGAQIVPSIDHLSAQKMGYCDLFHVDRCFENHGSAGQAGKKLTKTLMYFEGCPKPLGCTILLKGASGDELKKLKHVVQYGVFAAYHLALETSFLADEGASLPELQFNESITVALPNKSTIERSISIVSGLNVPSVEQQQNSANPQALTALTTATVKKELARTLSLPPDTVIPNAGSSLSCDNIPGFTNKSLDDYFVSKACPDQVSSECSTDKAKQIREYVNQEAPATSSCEPSLRNQPKYDSGTPWARRPRPISVDICKANNMTISTQLAASGPMSWQQQPKTIQDESGSLKEEFPPTPSDHQSILVSLSSRSVWKGTTCERPHLLRIKYYGSFDKPLGRFLQDHLFDQSYKCCSCGEPSEAHVHCYTHRQGTLTISVKKLEEVILPGEQEGKIWMWHRCLRCPRTNGFPPATRRVLMSDAAWGLSFGKFLELSFSNHAAASRVASCGHSLHRDCLRFYGSGKMVACFRYAPIYVYSVYLPPATLQFNLEIQDWIQSEADEVVHRAALLFSEVQGAIYQIVETMRGAAVKDGLLSPESRTTKIMELERALRNEKIEFEEMHRKALSKEVKKGHPAIDILELNRLRRQLLFQSYMWDHRFVHAAHSDYNSSHGHTVGFLSNCDRKTLSRCNSVGPDSATSSSHGILCRSSDLEGDIKNCTTPQAMAHKIKAVSTYVSTYNEEIGAASPCTEIIESSDLLESGSTIRRTLSDSQFLNLTDTLDAAWTGKAYPGAGGISKENNLPLLGSVSADASFAEMLSADKQVEARAGVRVQASASPAPSATSKSSDGTEDSLSWFGVPFLNFYHSLNKSFVGSDQKLDTVGGYNPVYVSSVRELGLQGGAKWLLPVGFNETVIPVYDDEPSSIISYALVSQDYHNQLSDEGERLSGTMESLTMSLQESASFHSFLSLDESMIESFRGRSIDETLLSAAGSRSSIKDPLMHTKSLHIKVSFTDNSPLDKVKYTVTCYYAKHFDGLRKTCCPSEMDFIRSLSRCKKWGAQGGKSNVFFAKTLDDRFIIKQVTKTELESFIKFAPEYFKYLTESISSKSPTCLAKILGIYQVVTKHLKGGKESKMDVLVMENLLFRRNVSRLYDLKGSSRSRYNPDSNGNNKVLLDQNLIESMPTSPIFVGNKAKRLLERAVWNDTSFLASVNVMDYSLLVGVDEEHHELVLGIIDFMRQYTWDKHLETWVKASGILGGPKNVSPTVISPKQYKKRFRKAMTTYFLMVPDQWSPSTIIPSSKSQTSLCEDNA